MAREGVEALRGVKPQVGVPIRPMLAERGRDPAEILRKVGGRAVVEYKYDGGEGADPQEGRGGIHLLEEAGEHYEDVPRRG
nr:hypothetical protein [Aeropyrum camini]